VVARDVGMLCLRGCTVMLGPCWLAACVALVGCLCFIFVELCLVLHVMFCRLCVIALSAGVDKSTRIFVPGSPERAT
jgi:hypothetical protein